MGQILKDIYFDMSLSSLLGLKGGTCAYFFYGLPRFSVDLDFDLLYREKGLPEKVMEKIKKILEKYGEIKDSQVKQNTILLWLSYGQTDHNIKIEISTRKALDNIRERFEIKDYLGISLLAAKQDYLFAGKLAALTMRNNTAMRDIYDIHYFAKNNWDIDKKVIKVFTGKDVKEYLNDCVDFINNIPDSQILRGLGEVVDEEEKKWIKKNLKNDTVFLLRNYIVAMD